MLAASPHLTDRDRDLVRLVATHRVLTTGQLAALGFGSIITARHRLSVLVRLGLRRRFRPHQPAGSAPWHYVPGPVGAAMLGTEHLAVLADKLDGYAVLACGLAWHDQPCPVLLFCFGSARREQAARRALAATGQAGGLRIATAALDPCTTSPAGPAWLPLHWTEGAVRLIDLEQALPDPWQDYRQQRARERREAAEREQALRRAADDYDDDTVSATGEEGSW